MPFSDSFQPNINLVQQRKRAKELCRSHRAGHLEAAVRIARHLPRARLLSPSQILTSAFTLSEAQFVVAREAGFSSWPLMKHKLDRAVSSELENAEALIAAAFVGNDSAIYATLERDPLVTRRSIFVAATLADADTVSALLKDDPSLATCSGGKRGWTPLLYTCFSRYRRDEQEANQARIRIVGSLMEYGADVNAMGRQPGFDDGTPWFALDGAAGSVASPELVDGLLKAGADARKTEHLLQQAVYGGKREVLRLALDAEPADWQINPALVACVELDRREMARMLVARVALPAWTKPALLAAIRLGCEPELIEILLGDDTRLELSGPVRQEAYCAALRYGHHAAAIGLLSRHGANAADVTLVDRVIAACVVEDALEMHWLLEQTASASLALGNADHQMVSWAVRGGRRQALLLLLEAGLDLNVADIDGNAPVHLAVYSGSLAMLEILLQAGADVNARNFQAQTPLELALTLPDASVREQLTRCLLAAGASPARLNQFVPSNTLLDEELRRAGAIEREDPDLLFESAADAVAQGDLEKLRTLLDEEPALVYARSPRPHRATLLLYCGANGTERERQRTPDNAPDIMRLLLSYGAEVDAVSRLYGGGCTTLLLLLTSHFPKEAGLTGEMVRVLADAGANLYIGGDYAAVTSAIDCGQRLGALALAEAGVPIDNLLFAAAVGRIDVLETLLSQGTDINTRYFRAGNTALHAAAALGQEKAVAFLLAHGADPRLRNTNYDSTPAGLARYFGSVEIAELMEKHPVSPEA